MVKPEPAENPCLTTFLAANRGNANAKVACEKKAKSKNAKNACMTEFKCVIDKFLADYDCCYHKKCLNCHGIFSIKIREVTENIVDCTKNAKTTKATKKCINVYNKGEKDALRRLNCCPWG